MGYSIHIGELIHDIEDNEPYDYVRQEEINEAPNFGFGDASGKTNCRLPSYRVFSNWAEEVGLEDLFFNGGLMDPYPGIKPITQEHLNMLKQAKENWEKENPRCEYQIPYKYKEPEDYHRWNFMQQELYDERFDWQYARLVWFEFWFDWALKNCKEPSLQCG